MIVTFCGHSSMPNKPEVTLKMETVLRNLFETNQDLLFYCGGYGEFDSLSASCVESIRKNYANVHCEKIFVTPYITEAYQEKNALMKAYYDDILYPPLETVPYKLAIIRRNEWMIKKSRPYNCLCLLLLGRSCHVFGIRTKKEKTHHKPCINIKEKQLTLRNCFFDFRQNLHSHQRSNFTDLITLSSPSLCPYSPIRE